MTDLEIYSAYLPYEIKFKAKDKKIYTLLHCDKFNIVEDKYKTVHKYSDCKLILRPLSELTKDNYKEMGVPMNIGSYNIKQLLLTGTLKYSAYLWLLKNHFDVFGLIEQGKAIDINTLNK